MKVKVTEKENRENDGDDVQSEGETRETVETKIRAKAKVARQ